jgi:hypothetical protein
VKARILPLDSDEHRFAQEHLPWFVNGTLDAAEATRLGAHLAHCPRCQADATAQAELRAAASGHVEVGGDVERDWLRLRSRLDAAPAVPAHRTSPLTRPWWKPSLQLAIALQAAVMLVLAVALIGVSYRSEPYRALGAAPASADANALAVFRADATEQQMRDALRAAGARIVGGPTVTDAYLLRMSALGPDALARLRAQPGVARVESLQGEATR